MAALNINPQVNTCYVITVDPVVISNEEEIFVTINPSVDFQGRSCFTVEMLITAPPNTGPVTIVVSWPTNIRWSVTLLENLILPTSGGLRFIRLQNDNSLFVAARITLTTDGTNWYGDAIMCDRAV